MQRGGSIGSGSAAKNANKGPLRKIVGLVRHSSNMFEADVVNLECGHTGRSWGGIRARCRTCLTPGPEPEEKA
jgi:hypothetical protein